MKIQFINILLIAFLPIFAQTTMANNLDSLWSSMPDGICPLKASAETINESEYSIIKRITPSSIIQLARLESTDGDKLICIIKTFSAPESESKLFLYDSSWNKLAEQEFALENIVRKENLIPDSIPAESRYATMTSDQLVEEIIDHFEVKLVSAELTDAKTLTLTLHDIMHQNDRKHEYPFLNMTRKLVWNGREFK